MIERVLLFLSCTAILAVVVGMPVYAVLTTTS